MAHGWPNFKASTVTRRRRCRQAEALQDAREYGRVQAEDHHGSQLLDEYISAATPNLKPRTVKRYREAIEVHLKPALGKTKLHQLDALKIEGTYS
jgi:hypothetical protein